ncbi:putative acetyl-CoA synthetase-like protein [Lyophyllum shimeji]|uniref:Acetyl-CoA synthetase-like protein n=1 Tax=Lyophyllum shimeji TaxID=47721 RepID=A0A9P3PS31_LYOSH|nr:putative acetyl-CoA synthetase-like protein [Lyophyllum shimeji]
MSTYPTPQAACNATFSPPPLDGTLTIPEIYDYHLQHHGDHPLFVYDEVTPQGARRIVTINWRRAVRGIYTAARIVECKVGPIEGPDEAPVVAILAVIDQLSYFALTAGIVRAGYRAFPISPRNSDVGVANLLQQMDVRYLFVSKDKAMQTIAASAVKRLAVDGIKVLEVPTFATLYGVDDATFQPLPPPRKRDIDTTVMILHSSGSTSFPKPILLSHRNILQWGTQPYYGETDICGRILSNHALPFFHAMGVVSLSWATIAGVTLSNFAPSDPPVVPTPDRLYTSATTTESKLIFCVPSFLEEWSMDPEKVARLATFDAVLFGGAPIQKAVGDDLAKEGVRLYPFYGATEIGGTSEFLPRSPPEEGWEYFKISSHADPIFLEQRDKTDVFQLVFRDCKSHAPAVVNIHLADVKSYDTNDLLIRHPTNPALWKIYGRADDQIMHSTGEKTNPVPMETIINRHPKVASCLMFGRGRFQTGVLVEPVEHCAFEPADLRLLAAFRNAMWPSVEEANKFAPSHSRIFKEMILVAKSSKPFQYTPKGTPRRHVILDAYEEEIEAGYATIEESAQTDISIPEHFDADTSIAFVRKTIEKVMMTTALRMDDDIFQHGCDSLQATWIRNTILHALRQSTKVPTRNIPINFVYLNPTIARLGNYVARVCSPSGPDDTTNTATETVAQMNALVEKYSTHFRPHKPVICVNGSKKTSDIVLLTGSTGGLGSYVLEALVLDDIVERVYALNRPSIGGFSSHERQRTAFEDRGIDCAILASPKIVFIEGDTSLPLLGLPQAIYEELRAKLSCIIHNAWRVDFNVAVSSMEPLIAGTRHLINLALSSHRPTPPRFLFTSSIGVVRNWSQGFAPEVPFPDAAVAVGSGYPESKWVAERILTIAAEQTTLRPVVVRIGQMSGGRNGSWNPVEWVPSIVRSGEILGCLPDAPGFISWIPAHTAASALVEMRNSHAMFLHLVHPSATPWSQLFKHISELLDIPLVSYATWLAALEASESSADGKAPNAKSVANPALRLLDFFKSADKSLPSDEADAFGFPRLSTKVAALVAPSFGSANLLPLGRSDVESWLGYWKRIGFLGQGSSAS